MLLAIDPGNGETVGGIVTDGARASMNWCNVDLTWAYGDLLGSIYRQTRSIDRAYDILHDSLVRMAMLDRREPIHQPHAYLRTVVQSVLARNGKDLARWLPFPDNDDAIDGKGHPDLIASQKLLDSTVDPQTFAPSPEHMATLYQRLRALQRIMDCLPSRCREVFWLYHVEGYSQREVAAKLSISVNMVERHVMRAFVDIWTAYDTLS
jgi:RNA polymerase sigma-70 factor (ECF subfamily)